MFPLVVRPWLFANWKPFAFGGFIKKGPRLISGTVHCTTFSGLRLEWVTSSRLEGFGLQAFMVSKKLIDVGERAFGIHSAVLMLTLLAQICDKYPEWLATHKERLATADYERYGRQYQSFQRVLAVYEVGAGGEARRRLVGFRTRPMRHEWRRSFNQSMAS